MDFYCTRLCYEIELFRLKEATAREHATILLEEVALRFWLPRKIISDTGGQFTSSLTQQICYLLKTDHNLLQSIIQSLT